jgi:hypothetical protein
VCVCARASVRVCVRACARARACECSMLCVHLRSGSQCLRSLELDDLPIARTRTFFIKSLLVLTYGHARAHTHTPRRWACGCTRYFGNLLTLQVCLRAHACVFACVRTCVVVTYTNYASTHVRRHTHIHTHAHTHVHTYTHACKYRTQSQTRKHHTHTHTHKHANITQACKHHTHMLQV